VSFNKAPAILKITKVIHEIAQGLTDVQVDGESVHVDMQWSMAGMRTGHAAAAVARPAPGIREGEGLPRTCGEMQNTA